MFSTSFLLNYFSALSVYFPSYCILTYKMTCFFLNIRTLCLNRACSESIYMPSRGLSSIIFLHIHKTIPHSAKFPQLAWCVVRPPRCLAWPRPGSVWCAVSPAAPQSTQAVSSATPLSATGKVPSICSCACITAMKPAWEMASLLKLN